MAPRWRPRGQPARAQGFTMVELIMVLVLIGILAIVALPRFQGSIGLAGAAWRQQVASALLQARTLAQGHRRLVCATVATNEVRLSMATTNPATACNSVVAGSDGDARWAHDGQSLTITQTPAGTLYFQPDGRITSDGAGASAVNVGIAISGERDIALRGETGHVE